MHAVAAFQGRKTDLAMRDIRGSKSISCNSVGLAGSGRPLRGGPSRLRARLLAPQANTYQLASLPPLAQLFAPEAAT